MSLFRIVGDLVLTGKVIFGQMPWPWSRGLVVDQQGRGDFTTIAAAVAYAKSQQTAAFERWNIRVEPGFYDEDVTITKEIHLLGSGIAVTTLHGSTILDDDATIHRMGLYNDGTGDFAVHLRVNASGQVAGIHDCYVYHTHSLDKPAIAVRVSGTPPGSAQALIRNSFLYAQNGLSAANAWAVGIHVASGTTAYTEVLGSGHIKTSNRAAGAAYMVWNEAADVTTGYAHVETPWIPSRADGSAIALLRGGAPTQYGKGLIFQGDIMPALLGTAPVFSTGGATGFPRRIAADLEATGTLTRRGHGVVTRPNYRSGSVYQGMGGSLLTGGTTNTVVLAVNVERGCAFEVHTRARFNLMTLTVSTAAAGSQIRLGIRSVGTTGRPDALVVDAGFVDSSTVGQKQATIDVTLEPGTYWLMAGARGGAPTVHALSGGPVPFVEQNSSAEYNSYTGTLSTDALPATFVYSAPVYGPPRILLRATTL